METSRTCSGVLHEYPGRGLAGSMGRERYTHVMRDVQTLVRNAVETVWWDAHVPPRSAAWEQGAEPARIGGNG
ncbi:hypothetical protein GCM10010219_03030 [Streptomyces netropsis]|nr:hypothetical protein GCM10010219_03030 [Streptomyces netropsis]